MSLSMKKRFPSLTSIDVESDGNTSFLRAARNGQLDKVLEHLKSNIDINTSNANGLNALHLASKDGHVEIVEELLKRGAVVDAATKKGNTALHIASLAGQEEVVKLLVQHGASVNVQSQNGFTPLYMAAQENHDNVVKYLLANGANQSLSTEDGFTPLAVAMQQGHDKVVTVLLENDTRGKVRLPALHIAAKKDDVKAAKLLLENEHNPDVTSKSGFTPLHIASHYGNQQIANLLIQKGADVNYAAKHNITPLHVAAKWGKANMVAILLDHGAAIESKTRDGLTPLHCAARSGHEQVVDMLLERGAPISSKTKNGLAPLHMAAQGDHVDAARILLYHRAPVDEVTVDYLTALHVAAHCGHVRVAKLLLDRQADANARALNGFTPLHIACKKNRIKVVELLLKHGASIGATTESGLTPLHVASFMGCMNIVIYLLQHDANPDVPTVRGETPLHLAARANQTDIIRILLRNGAQVDARAREQQTPLHIASRLGNVDIVMLLLQHGAKVDNATKDMYTALHIAAKEGQDEVAAVLIDNGASLNATTKKGFTPLHLASKYGHLKVAKLLLQKEAPVDAQGKNGVTPLHVASHYDHQNVALLLLDKGASPHATAKNGHTPLHIAARKNQMDIANTLLEYGAQPNAESKAGFTPLHLSAQEGHTDMSSLLIENKADVNHKAKNGLTPLHLCAQEDRVGVAEILVKNEAEIDAATKGGYTPLHTACHYGQVNMVRFLLNNGASVKSTTAIGYTPLHQAAQQGHTSIVNILLDNSSDPNAITHNGQTPLHIAQKLGYITVIETLKVVTQITTTTTTTTTIIEEKYKVVAPEAMHETFMSDSEEEGGEDTILGDHTYRYLTADEMKSLGDDSLPIDVTRDERIDSNRMVNSVDGQLPPEHFEDHISPEHITQNYVEYIKKYKPDNVDINQHPINIGFLVSFLVDARGGAMRGCRHSGVRVIVPPRSAPSPTRITCRYVRPQRTPHPPPLMEGEALASRVLELGPVGAKFLGPVIIEVPHFAALRGKEREIVILRSDNGESWKEHTVEATEEVLNEVLHDSFEAEDLSQMEDISSGRITRILTQDFPQYFAVVSRIRQEVHAIGPEGGMVSSTVVPQVQAVFPEGALTKKIKVGLQAQPIDPELTAKLLGHGVAVSPVVTVEPRRRKFHKAITLSMPAPRAHSQGMINQYSGSAPTLRLLCSITGGVTRAQWEDVTGSTPLTFVNDCVSFTTTVSARFWLMDCRNIGDATKMATELYKEAIHVPFMAKFVVFAKRVDPLEARLRVFCMTDDKEDKTLEHQEHFTEVAKSRDVEVLEGKPQYIEFAGNLVPITKSGEQLQFSFRAFRENRLPFSVRVKDQHAEAVSRCLFMREPKVPKGEPPQQPICILNIVLPDDIVSETVSLNDSDSIKKHFFLSESFDYYRQDPRLADMSNLLGEDWVQLANQLGLTTSEINVIKSEYPDSVAKQAQSMLRMWLSQSGNKAQTNTLENALRRIGREDIIPQCLNAEHPQTITRIKLEEKGKRLIKDGFDKYSAEEKLVGSDEEEDGFNKTVTERRQLIEERLSAERAIPASSQRVEIVQEIGAIKRQSLVEDKREELEMRSTEPLRMPMKVHETKTVTTKTPDGKTVSEIVEVKTTETRISETEELSEGVTRRLEERTTTKLTAESSDPTTPKLSKTPPPSPADFLVRDKAATAQEWDAAKKPDFSSRGPASPLEPVQQGKPTTTTYIANIEEVSLVPVGDPRFGFASRKDVYDQTNALIQSESRAEPYHPHTDRHYRIIPDSTDDEKQDSTKTDSLKEERKAKKSILGSLKTFVSKSLDHSDSDSERSSKTKKPKKDKKKKKDKKAKDELPPEVPARPPRKPKAPTPTEERRAFDDIPYVEASPSDTPIKYPSREKSLDKTTHSETNLVKVQSKETIVITNGDSPKSPKGKEKQKTITVVEEVVKTFQPVVIQSEQFSIVIDPTKKETPKKERETFTLNIDESIDQIEKEILEKSPILPEEKIKKPEIDFDSPIPPLRYKEPEYEDIEEPVISQRPDNLVSEPQNLGIVDDDHVKKVTLDLIKNEMEFTGWVDDPFYSSKEVKEPEKITDSQKMKRKQGKLFGLFKSSKDVEDSDEDSSRKEIVEKQDKEVSKEKKVKRGKSKEKDVFSDDEEKKGFLGLFGKKKKEQDIVEKPLISEEVLKNMKDSKSFLDQEVSVYHDCRPVVEKTEFIKEEKPEKPQRAKSKEKQKKEDDEDQKGFLGLFSKKTKKIEETEATLSPEVVENITNTKNFLNTELIVYEDGKPVSKQEQPTITVYKEVTIKKVEATPKPEKESKEEPDGGKTETKDLSQQAIEDMAVSKDFLKTEVDKFHDCKPVISKEVKAESVSSETQKSPKMRKSKSKEKREKSVEDDRKGFLGMFSGKKGKKDEETAVKVEPSEELLKNMRDTSNFLNTEINNFEDCRPIVKKEAEEKPVIMKETTIEHIEVKKSPKKEKKQKEGKDKSLERGKSLEPEGEKKGFLGLFGKKPKKESESEEQAIKAELSEKVKQTLKNTEAFLNTEIEKFHDCRPIIKAEEPKETILVESTAEKVEISPKKKKDKSLERGKSLEPEEEKKGLFGLFGKKSKKDSDTQEVATKAVLSPEILKTLKDTGDFLNTEIEKFHDCRPIVKPEDEPLKESPVILKETIIEKIEKSPKKKGKDKSLERGKSLEPEEEKKGFLGLFGKKSKKGETEEVVQKIPLSEELLKNIKDTEGFLKTEIDKFHDCRPVIKAEPDTVILKETIVEKVEKSPKKGKDKSLERGKSLEPEEDKKGFLGLFGKKSKKEEEKIEPATKAVLSEEIIKTLKDTEDFLNTEIDKFHDCKVIIKPEQKEAIVTKETIVEKVEKSPKKKKDTSLERGKSLEPEEEKKGFLGLFGKKSKKDEEKVLTTKPVLSEELIQTMKNTEDFLKTEVDKFHDCRPIVEPTPETKTILKETIVEKVEIKPPPRQKKPKKAEREKSQEPEEKKGFLGLFGKKTKKDEGEEATEPATKPAELSEETKQAMKESGDFLSTEIDKYHDCKPIIKKEEPSEQVIVKETIIEKIEVQEPTKKPKKEKRDKSEERGFLGMFGKKTKKDEDTETATKSELSAEVLQAMKDSKSFLQTEVEVFHDCRPVIKKEPEPVQIVKEVIVEKLEAKESPKPKKDKIKKDKVQRDKSEERGFLGLFSKKKDEKPEDVTSPPVLSPDVVKTMEDTRSFLSTEIEKFHDCKPIIKPSDKPQEEVIIKETIVEKIELEKSPKSKKEKKREPSEDREEKKGFLGLFGKKSKKDEEPEPATAAILSEEILKNIEDTNNFLKTEIDKFHDCRPIIPEASKPEPVIIKETIIEKMEESPKKKEKKPKRDKSEDRDEKKGFLGLFGKKKKEEEPEPAQPAVLSEEILKSIEDTNSFLKTEIEKFHDCRPVVSAEKEPVILKETIVERIEVEESPKLKKEKKPKRDKSEDRGFLGLFGKKKDEEVAKKTEFSEETINILNDTSDFLRTEIVNFHDYRPIVTEKPTMKETSEKVEAVKSPKVDSSEDKEDKKGFLGLFGKKGKKDETQEIAKPVILSEDLIKTMVETKSFLDTEIEKFHDCKPIIKEPQSEVKESILKVESPKLKKEKKAKRDKSEDRDEKKGFLGLFGKKKKDEDEEVAVKGELTEEMKKTLDDTNNFLQTEIEKFHDCRPVIKLEPEETIVIKETIIEKLDVEKSPKAKKDKKPKKAKSEDYDEKKSFLGIFGKKQKKEDEEVEPAVKATLTEEQLKTMDDTKNFLITEIEKFHDCRPVISEPVKKPEVEKSPKKDKKSKEEQDSGFFGLFGKKPQKETETGLSEQVLKDMKDSKEFLNIEQTVYEDGKPVAKKAQEVMIKESVQEKLEGQKPSKQKRDKSKEREEEKGFLGLFGKKGKKEEISTIELSPEIVEEMKKTSEFLKTEVEQFEDFRPIVTDDSEKVQKSPKIFTRKIKDKEGADKEKKSDKGILGLFVKKGKTEEGEKVVSPEAAKAIKDSDEFPITEVEKFEDVKQVTKETVTIIEDSKNIHQTTNFLNNELDSYEDGKLIKREESIQEAVAPTVAEISQNALLDMISTGSFLKEEISRYHDVRPIIKKDSTLEQAKAEEEKQEKKGLLGLFSKKKSQDRESSLEKEPKEPKKKEKKKTTEIKKEHIKPQLSEEVLKSMRDSKDFLSKEVDLYHDCKILPPKSIAVKTEAVPSKSEKEKGGFFGLFSKKPKEEKEKKQEDQSKVIVLTEEAVKDITDSSNFILTELEKYEDSPRLHKSMERLQTDVLEEPENLEIFEPVPVEPLGASETVIVEGSERQPDQLVDKKPFTVITKEVKFEQPSDNQTIETTTIKEVTEEKPNQKQITTTTKQTIIREIVTYEPSVQKEVTDFEQAIKDQIDQVKKEAERLNDEFIILQQQPIPSAPPESPIHDTHSFLEQEKLKYEDSELVKKEEVRLDEKEKSPMRIFGIFGKKKSESQEKEVVDEEEKVKEKGERKKSGSPFKIFSKKKSEDEAKKTEPSGNIEHSEDVLVKEVVKYEDKPRLVEEKEAKKKFTDSPKKDKEEKRKSGGFFGIFKSTDQQEPPNISEETLKQMKDTKSFLDTEQELYEDGKPLVVTDLDKDEEEPATQTGLFHIFSKKEKSESPKTPKKKLRKHKREKSEDSDKEGFIEKLGKKITDAVHDVKDKVHSDSYKVKHEVEDLTTETYRGTEDVAESIEEKVKQATLTVDEVLDTAAAKVSDTKKQAEDSKTMEELVDEFKVLEEKLAKSRKDVEQDLEKTSEQIGKDGKQFLGKLGEKIDVEVKELDNKSQAAVKKLEDVTEDTTSSFKRDVLDVTEETKKAKKEAQKKGKKIGGFFSKLGDKVSGKSTEVKEDVENLIDEVKKETDQTEKRISSDLEQMDNISYGSNNLVSDLMESFDSKMQDIKTGTQDLQEQVEGKIEEATKPLQETKENIESVKAETLEEVDKKIKEVKDSKDSADKLIDQLDKQVKDIHVTTGDFLKKTKEGLEKEVDKGIEKTGETVSSTQVAAKEKVSDLKEEVEQAAKKSGGFLSKLGGKIAGKTKETKDKALEATDKTKKSLKETKDSIDEKVTEKIDEGEKAMESAKRDLESVKDQLQKDTKDVTISVTQTLDKGAETIKSETEDFAESVKEEKDKAVKKTGSFLSKLGDKISGKSKEVKDKVVISTEKAKEQTKETVDESVQKVKEEVGIAKDKIKEGIEKTKATAGEVEEAASEKLTEAKLKGEKIVEGVEDSFKSAKDATIEAGKDISESISTTGKEIELKAGETSDSIKQKVEETAKDVKEKTDEAAKKTGSFLSNLSDIISGKSKEVENKVMESAERAKESSKEVFNETVKKVEEGADTVTDKAQKTLEETNTIAADVKEAASEKITAAKVKSEEVVGKVKDDLDVVKNKVTETGKDASQAITQTAEETVDSVKQKAEQSAEGVQKGAEKAAKKTSGFLSKLGGKISGKPKEVKDKVSESVDKSKKVAKDSIESTIVSVESGGKTLENEAKKGVEEIKAAAGENAELISKELKETKEKVEDQTKQIAEESQTVFEKAKLSGAQIKDNLAKDIEAAKDGIVDKTEQTILGAETEIKSLKKETTEFLEDASKKVEDSSRALDKKSGEILDTSIEKTEGLLSNLKDQITSEAEKAKHETKDAIGHIIEEVKEVEKGLESTIAKTESEVKDIGNQACDVTNRIKGSADKKITEVDTAIQEDTQKLKDKLSESEDKLAKAVKQSEEATTEAVSSAQAKVDDTVKDIKDDTDKAVKKTGGFLSKLGDKISGKTKETKDQISDAAEKTKAAASSALTEISETTKKVEDKTAEIVHEIKDSAHVVKEETAQKFEDSKEAIVDTTKAATDSMKESGDKAVKKTGGFLTKLGDKISGKSKEAKDKVSDSIDKTKQAAEDVAVSVDTTTKQIAKDVTDAKEDASAKIREAEAKLSEAKQETEAKTAEIVEDVTETTEKTARKTSGFLSKLGDKISGKSKETKDKLTESLQQTEDQLEQSAEDVQRRVKKTEETIKTTVKDTGDKISQSTTQAETFARDSIETVKSTAEKAKSDTDSFLQEARKDIEETSDGVLSYKTQPEVEELETEKQSKKSKGILGKIGRKLSGKGDELKEKRKSQSPDPEQKSKKGFISKIGEKMSSKDKEDKESSPSHQSQSVKQTTQEFLDDLRGLPESKMTRTISDYMQKEPEQDTMKISEANIDLSTLPSNLDEYPEYQKVKVTSTKSVTTSYVTTPTSVRRAISQSMSLDDQPVLIEVTTVTTTIGDLGDEGSYTVTEPEEMTGLGVKKKLFHLESEDDDSSLHKSFERSDSTKSNVLETLSEGHLEGLISDLTKSLDEATTTTTVKIVETKIVKSGELILEEHKKESEADVEMIEQKLRDLDKALGSLEQSSEERVERKLKRVERKFERMASEAMEKDRATADLTSPELEQRREREYETLTSQMSAEEVSSFQKEYGHLWEEHSFSKSDESKTSKTPDSQTDVQELPQGKAGSSTGATAKAEGEQQSQRVADQHQLSEEMKELLKELEKESKQ